MCYRALTCNVEILVWLYILILWKRNENKDLLQFDFPKKKCNDPRKSVSHICAIPQKDQSLLRLLVVVNKAQIYPVNTQCGTHHTPTHITQSINQVGVSQYPPLKSLTSSSGPTLLGSVSETTLDYQLSSDTICNDPRKSASHICTIPQKDQSQLKLLAIVNKAQFNPINTRCGTHYTPTHITQSIKLEHHNSYVTTQGKALATSALYLKKISHN